MAIRVHNTLTKTKEEFRPEDPKNVRIYVCGITPYAASHIGHSRFSILWDVIRNYLEYRGYGVSMVQNFTDVEDKLIEASRESGRPAMEIARKHIRGFLRDMKDLGVKPAHYQPRASDHIEDIIQMIKRIIERGHAYVIDGDVYFDVNSLPGYGKLSGRSRDDVQAGARVDVDARKKDPRDFAVWKAAKPGEPAWPSPWGPGRPGWHIECSAMSLKYLGEDFDFHGGGTDLIFPHHENEIAQSEAYLGGPRFARIWVHHEMLNLRAQKMSKSLGNIVSIREVLDRFPGPAVRLFVLSTHYRKILEFSMELLEESTKGWQRLQKTVNDATAQLWAAGWRKPVKSVPGSGGILATSRARFEEAMDDDFNTAQAIGVLFDLARDINTMLSSLGSNDDTQKLNEIGMAVDLLILLGGVLGVVKKPRIDVAGVLQQVTLVYEKWTEKPAAKVGPAPKRLREAVNELLRLREQARKNKEWAKSDGIRKDLAAAGIRVDDSKIGSRWRPEVKSAWQV